MFDSVLPGRGRPRPPRTTPLGGQRRFAVATPPQTTGDHAAAPHDGATPGERSRPGGSGPGRADGDGTGRGRLQTLVRGREGDPGWIRPALLAVLAGAAFLLLWNLSENGSSNTYYAAAVKSATVSWKAWFFGSLDPGSFITVDKPPLSIWLMGLSTRVLGYGSFSMLLPQALCTLASVGLLYATVRRGLDERLGSSAAAAAGLLAAALLAVTPITVAIGRVNNPDALLILLLVASAYATMRAVEGGRTKWLVWAGVFVGLAFMTKMLQGWMIVPALGAVYLLAGPPKLLARIRQLAVAGVVMAVVSAAWPTAVSLWPGSKPYIGGSDDGSAWNLILGYNGLGRLTGNENGMGGGGGGSFGGTAGVWRMFNDTVGAQIAWLLPLSVLSLVATLWLTRRAPRTDGTRAVTVLLGVWLVVHLLIFSFAKGTFHPYYSSAMAPAIAGLGGVGLVLLLREARTSIAAHVALVVAVAGTAWMSVELLGRATDFQPWLRVLVPVLAGLAVVLSIALRRSGPSMRRAVVASAVAAVIAIAAGPASYSVASVGRSLDGDNVLAGPASASRGGFGGGMGGPGGGRGGFPGGPGQTAPSGAQGGTQAGAQGLPPGSATGTTGTAASSTTPGAGGPAGGIAGAPTGRGAGGPGGGGDSLGDAAITYLEQHQGTAKYLVAATGARVTESIILKTGKPVVTIGGFTGSDPTPTVPQLAAMVKSGQLKYVLVSGGGGFGGGGGGGTSSALDTWVQQHGKAVSGITVSSGTLYAVSAS